MQINFASRIPPPSRHLPLLLQICGLANFIIVRVVCLSDAVIPGRHKNSREDKYERLRKHEI